MDWKMFGKGLRERRQKRGLTQKDLAKAAGRNHRQISLYERGLTEPKMVTMVRLARALGCTVDELTREARLAKTRTPVRTLLR